MAALSAISLKVQVAEILNTEALENFSDQDFKLLFENRYRNVEALRYAAEDDLLEIGLAKALIRILKANGLVKGKHCSSIA